MKLVRRVITRMIEDVISESPRRRSKRSIRRSVADVRKAGRPVVGFSSNFAAADRAIGDFLYPRLYRHDRIMRIMQRGRGHGAAAVRALRAEALEMPPNGCRASSRTTPSGGRCGSPTISPA